MRWLGRRSWFAALGALTLVAVLVAVAGSAEAAFPGRDGLLAVQPLKGRETVLIEPDGRGKRLMCVVAVTCGWGFMARPEWSPDGRTLVVGGAVIYPDGSCLDCGAAPKVGTVFTANPTLLTSVVGHHLVEYSIDGLARRVLLSGAVSDAVWSSRSELALVRGGWIWVGRPGKLHRFAPGSVPAWSPDGSRIVFDRRGWLMVGAMTGSVRRLMRGTAPAWSPDGKWIAFFAKAHRLSVVRPSGGRVRRVGGVTGWTVDWQPIPSKPPAACLTPPGSQVMAGSDTAVLSVDYEGANWSVMGCLRAGGRERELTTGGPFPISYVTSTSVSDGAVAGNYAALVSTQVVSGRQGPPGSSSTAGVWDLPTAGPVEGPKTVEGGESTHCPHVTGTSCRIDRLLLGSDAVSAVHITDVNNGCSCTVEQIQASDSAGVRTLDSVTEPDGSAQALTNLTLTGDMLTWEHDGIPESAELTP